MLGVGKQESPCIEPAFISNTERHVMTSIAVSDEFAISVSLPKDYHQSDRSYPVAYILDSNIFYGLFTDTARLLQYGKEIPELIIVGVGYPNDHEHMLLRNRDYLPTYNKASERSGQAKTFLDFMEKELLPFIASSYRVVSGDYTLAGDSYSGLFGLYTLFNRPKLFSRYIIGSPSIYWDDRVILSYEEALNQSSNELEARVFMSVGALEAVNEPAFARMVSNVVELDALLKDRRYKGLKLTTHVFEGETHQSVIPATMSRGLREVFK